MKFTICSAGAIGFALTTPLPNSSTAHWLPQANHNKPAGLFGSTKIGAKLVVQSKLNTTLVFVDFMHLKLVGRHVAKGIAECFNPRQQFFAAALNEIAGRNVACERVRKCHNLDTRT